MRWIVPSNLFLLNARTEALSTRLRAMILREGPIDFETFLSLVLYDPTLGYYPQSSAFGPEGDFTTAPHMGPWMAQALARTLRPELERVEHRIIELGAGDLTLAQALCEILRLQDYAFWDPSFHGPNPKAPLRKLEGWPLSSPVPALVLAHELLDALPFRRIRLSRHHAEEWRVDVRGEDFVWGLHPIDDPLLLEHIDQLQPWVAEGCVLNTECRPSLADWFQALDQSIACGPLIVIDYAYDAEEYYHPRRTDGTLRCYSRHQADSDPLKQIGMKDITAHVDATHLKKTAQRYGWHLKRDHTQAEFLAASLRDEDVMNASPEDRALLKTLIMPYEMGNIRVMVFEKEKMLESGV